MAESLFDRSRPHLNVAVLGHRGHGKTTLCAAIRRALARRAAMLPGARSFDPRATAGFAPPAEAFQTVPLEAVTEFRHYALLDGPGDRDRLKNVAAGLAGADVAVLVVSAVEGAGVQTREHALVARGAGIGRFVVFLNACDRVEDPAWIDEVELDARRVLFACGVQGDEVPVVRGGAGPAYEGKPEWEDTVLDLLRVLDRDVAQPARIDTPPAVALVTTWYRRYTSDGGRDVVIGAVGGRHALRPGERYALRGLGVPDRRVLLRSVEVFKRAAAEAQAGDILGLRLQIEDGPPAARKTLRRGMVVGSAALALTTRFRCALEVCGTHEGARHTPLYAGHRGHFFLGAASVAGRITLPDGEETLWFGDRNEGVTVELERPVFVEPGMGFSMRDGYTGKEREGRAWGGLAATGVVRERLEDAPKPEAPRTTAVRRPVTAAGR